jgi:hypothetical protein
MLIKNNIGPRLAKQIQAYRGSARMTADQAFAAQKDVTSSFLSRSNFPESLPESRLASVSCSDLDSRASAPIHGKKRTLLWRLGCVMQVTYTMNLSAHLVFGKKRLVNIDVSKYHASCLDSPARRAGRS